MNVQLQLFTTPSPLSAPFRRGAEVAEQMGLGRTVLTLVDGREVVATPTEREQLIAQAVERMRQEVRC